MPTVIINGKKHTPSSGTLKKMKAKAAAAAAMKKATPVKPKVKAKAPVPASMSDSLRNKRAADAASKPKAAVVGKVETTVKPKADGKKAPVPARMSDDLRMKRQFAGVKGSY